MSDREKLPGDPSLPPGVSQRDIDNHESDYVHCLVCGCLIPSWKDTKVCTCCETEEGEE